MLQNLLRHETSPYLLQHQSNPVHWRPWGSAAIAEARREDKPILLSIGYAACHWCHVMAHESFEDAATAAVMNRLFVNIKVDREERPDVDQIYMAALHAIGEQGGWPLTMFLTPDGQPIWGGTYFPKTAHYGRPAFVDILTEVARIYREEPDKVRTNRAYIMDRLNKTPDPAGPHIDRTLLDQAAERLLGFMDGVNGGVRGAPKFPQASLLELLWRSGLRTGRRDFIDAVTLTLRRLSEGGIYDHLGGGFARYSVDDRWLVPHFEKMLYDNAQLIELMTYAASTTDAPLFKARISETIDWLARDMTSPSGAFAASIDADSDGHEGKFYVWTLNEILEVLGPAVGPFFADFYDVRPEGNWEDASILNQLHHTAAPSAGDQSRAAESRQKLLARRNTRIPPAIDDKILADWNGLAIAALALAGAVHDRSDWVTRAAAAFGAVRDTMTTNGRLAHSWCAGKATYPGLATDYAAMIKAALALFTATLDVSYAHQAEAFAEMVRRHHFDSESSGYYLSADDAEDLIVRPRSVADEATPSANSLMAANLVRLWRITGNDQYRAEADALLAASGAAVAANLFAGAGMLSALDLRLGAIDVVLVRPPHAPVDDMVRAVHANLSPNIILTVHDEIAAVPTEHPAFGKRALDGRVTAYVCRGETCSLPVNDPAALAAMLSGPPPSA